MNVSLCFFAAVPFGCVSDSKIGARELGGPGIKLGHVNDFLVPVKGCHLANKGTPFVEGCIRLLGDVQIMDHLAGHASEAMIAVAMMGST